MGNAREQKLGVFYALFAFGFWGLNPFYFRAVHDVLPVEVLCHRIVWSVPLLAVIVTLKQDWSVLFKALSNKKVIGTLFLTACLAATNWYIYIYSIDAKQVLQASLGYFINPLVNVLLGMVFLRERLRPLQMVAVLLAALGTIKMTVSLGGLPWISLSLAVTFSLYGFFRKTVSIESVNGLFVETTLVSPLALIYLVFMYQHHQLRFGYAGWWTTFLLVLAGVVTALPLMSFTSGARRIQYTTIGICQYLAPSLQFCVAIFFFGETFTMTHVITFGLIWSGLVVFMIDSIAYYRRHSLG